MEAKVISLSGKEPRTIELSDSVFGLPINEDVIWYAVTNELANSRVGTASTRDRSEVRGTRGTNRKPFSQKGRARHGDLKANIFVGGGVSFGPKPRDYSYSIPRKEKQLSLKTILSLKVQDELVLIVEDFAVESGKTKDLLKVLSNVVDIKNPERTVLILKDDDPMIKRAARNIPWLTYLTYNRLRAHDLFYARRIIIMEGASAKLNVFYAKATKES